MILRLRQAHQAQIQAHVETGYPAEACGIFLGREAEGIKIVEQLRLVDNRWADPAEQTHRFLIPPEEVLAAEREAAAAGLEILGFFHSHPDHPARPSNFDREHAWPWYAYLIVSVENGQATDWRVWELTEDRSAFVERRLEIVP
ncbi:M67 family metallopeptidase [Thermoflexus sp.]|uniref:M67 family metallopeptidase n=1 Tax=Thermoflexus sp. TaxID=1969742 RepID=UPI0025F9CEBB|nr:M67 family metallopeptidase [Thermoflexus sp.]MDW8180919.1 M67 family metallopeptidase [Anaerolineae bacterium]MCS6963242.1 M67 family metallopeptidase [Thermoflexus sp.]MCS7351462.1 M67 family metallopeptidase [Thermoflexus sp.]MCX7691227.1 M67 family metallopeptidase [Thermoflexus sp.]MDW8184979.1 M67 family metallopeptidase [Anaerolineae bacterium]